MSFFRILPLAMLLLAAPATAHSHKTKEHEHHASAGDGSMPNFGVVWEHKLTRSGLPDSDSGWVWLHSQGVHSIVTFLEEHDVDYAGFGFANVLQIPLSSDTYPTEGQAQRFLAFIQDPARQPVHIHCKAGRDRTGMMAALARYAVDSWPLTDALTEARRYRGGKDLEAARIGWLRAWAAKHPPGSARVRPVEPSNR